MLSSHANGRQNSCPSIPVRHRPHRFLGSDWSPPFDIVADFELRISTTSGCVESRRHSAQPAASSSRPSPKRGPARCSTAASALAASADRWRHARCRNSKPETRNKLQGRNHRRLKWTRPISPLRRLEPSGFGDSRLSRISSFGFRQRHVASNPGATAHSRPHPLPAQTWRAVRLDARPQHRHSLQRRTVAACPVSKLETRNSKQAPGPESPKAKVDAAHLATPPSRDAYGTDGTPTARPSHCPDCYTGLVARLLNSHSPSFAARRGRRMS